METKAKICNRYRILLYSIGHVIYVMNVTIRELTES